MRKLQEATDKKKFYEPSAGPWDWWEKNRTVPKKKFGSNQVAMYPGKEKHDRKKTQKVAKMHPPAEIKAATCPISP